MKVVVIGATGFVGSHIVNELTSRNIQVTGISRNEKVSGKNNLKYVAADVKNVEALAEILKQHNVVVSAFGGGWTNPNIYEDFINGSKAIQQAVKNNQIEQAMQLVAEAEKLGFNDARTVFVEAVKQK